MGLLDFTYRLKPETGDTVPNDELGLTGDLSGGTITLVDDGTGGKAWRFTGGTATATTPDKTVTTNAAAGGVTMAIRLKIASGSVNRYMRWRNSAGATTTNIGIRGSSATVIQGECYGTNTAGITHGADFITVVVRVTTSATASQDFVEVWWSGGSLSTTPDDVSAGATLTNGTVLNTLSCGVSGTTLDVADWVLWSEELSAANIVTLVTDGIRATLDGGGSAPTLTAPTGVATGTTTATIGATTDTASGTIYGVVTTSATAPSIAQIAAGQDHTGATAAASGNTGTLTTSGTKTINVTGLTASTTYRAHLYHDDASGDSAVVTSAAFITDVTSPSLSAQTASSAAPLTCQGSVSTNEGNGTLYAVVTASATAPSAAQVRAGQDHTGAAALRVISQAVSGTGTQSIASGSVTAGTRYMHFMHEDAAGNRSAVVSSASFVVAATFSITTDALEDETGAVLASVTLTRAYAIRLSDHTLVASWASPATNGSGQLVLADAALTAVPHLLATVSNSNADAGAKVYTPG